MKIKVFLISILLIMGAYLVIQDQSELFPPSI